MQRLKISGAIPPLSLYSFMTLTGTTLHMENKILLVLVVIYVIYCDGAFISWFIHSAFSEFVRRCM